MGPPVTSPDGGRGAVNRRDFLRLRPASGRRVLELSCRRLFMQYVDSERLATAGATLLDPADDAWHGEPSPELARRAADFLVRQLERDLVDVEVLHVVDEEWLAPLELDERLTPILERFQARGGQVQRTRGKAADRSGF